MIAFQITEHQGQWRPVILDRQDTNKRSLPLSQLAAWRDYPDYRQLEGAWFECRRFPGLRDTGRGPGRWRRLETTGMSTREERASQRNLKISRINLRMIWLIHLRKYQKKNHLKALEEIVPNTRIGTEMVPTATNQTGKPHNSQSIGGVLGRFLPLNGE